MPTTKVFKDKTITIAIEDYLYNRSCPAGFSQHDLYIFRDPKEKIVLYIGTSSIYSTYRGVWHRIWQHLMGGFTGHSTIGEFIVHTWPHSSKFTITLVHSKGKMFKGVGNAERFLIHKYSPVHNVAMNPNPLELPENYYAKENTQKPISIDDMIAYARDVYAWNGPNEPYYDVW